MSPQAEATALAVETLYRERRLSVAAIAQRLHISKSTLYGYLRHRGVAIGPYEKPGRGRTGEIVAKGVQTEPKVATIMVWLRIANNNKFVRGKKRALESIEHHCLAPYDAVLQPNGEYALKIPYAGDEDLDEAVSDLLSDIAREAEARNCFSESEARMDGTDRNW